MLQADKQLLLAGVKRNALGLRQRELEFNVERYTNLATQASVIAGFSFESLVELEVPEGTHWLLSSVYFVFGSSAMALSLYVLCVASFGVVFGHRLALQGPHGSLERAVTILISHRLHLFSVAGMALACLVLAAVCMSWIKMGAAAAVVSGIFVAFFVAVAWRLRLMAVLFDIPLQQLVTGAVTVAPPNQPAHAGLDLSHLNPGARAAAASSSSGAAGGAAGLRYQEFLDEEERIDGAGGGGGGAGGGGAGGGGGGAGGLASPPRPVSLQAGAGAGSVYHEGHLFKKGEGGAFSTSEPKRRYFVLKGANLYYYKTWEDFASGGRATNAATPISLADYEPKAPSVDPHLNKIDLVPASAGLELARVWELQAPSTAEFAEWMLVLQEARELAQKRGGPPGIGAARTVHLADG
jgi:uncharacterized membrane protein